MIKYKKNDKFRIKVTDKCNFSCPFCHAEGGMAEKDIAVDQSFTKAIGLLRPLYNRVHITGGEPFLYEKLYFMVEILKAYDYEIAITTNGLFPRKERLKIIEKLNYINFSLHSLQRGYTSCLLKSGQWTDTVLSIVKQNIEELNQMLPVRVNAVVSDDNKGQRLEAVFEFCGERNIELKLVPEWSVRRQAMQIIDNLLKKYEFSLYEKIYIVPGSNVRERYMNRRGQIIEVKNIELFFPDFLCENCKKQKWCQEGFSFLRVGGNPLYFQSCILGKKLDYEEFQKDMLSDIYAMFKRKVDEKCSLYAEKEE